MSFSERLKERRESLSMSRAELAAKLGVTASAIGNYENGVSSPKIEILYKIFEVLKVDPNYLWQDELSNVVQNFPVAHSERELLQKIRTLDEYGKDMVATVVEKEYERVHSTANAQHDYTRNVLTLAANADKAEPGSLTDDVLNDILAQADKLQRKGTHRK